MRSSSGPRCRNANTSAIRPIFVDAFSSEGEAWISRGCSSHRAHSTAIFSLGRISTMIQNFERTVQCYNHTVPHPIHHPHQPSSHAVHVSTSNWVSTKKQSTHTAPVAGPSENDSKQTDQNNFSTFDPRIKTLSVRKRPAIESNSWPCVHPTDTNPLQPQAEEGVFP